ESTKSLSVLLGNGDGTLGPRSDIILNSDPTFLAIRDLNGDGNLDLVWPNYYDSTLSVRLGNGDGTFGPLSLYATRAHPYSVAIADLNMDGKLDLAVVN